MPEVILQLGLAAAMFTATAIAGLLPIKLIKMINKNKNDENKVAAWFLTLLSCFAGGVFLGTCFLDIIPHVNSNYAKFRANMEWKAEYPLPEFFVCCGFFLVYFLEELFLKLFSPPNHHSHSHLHHKTAEYKKLNQPLEKNRTGSVNGDNQLVCESDDDRNSASEKYTALRPISNPVLDQSLSIINSDISGVKSLTFVAAMSLHSILEGFALGVQDNSTGIMTLFISLIIHKGIESFGVGLQISKAHTERVGMVVLAVLVYALMTPFGSCLGVWITNMNINELSKDAIVIFLEGLAGGTFIYVTFFEVLAMERANKHSNLIQLSAIIFGFAVIAALQINEHLFSTTEHSHGH